MKEKLIGMECQIFYEPCLVWLDAKILSITATGRFIVEIPSRNIITTVDKIMPLQSSSVEKLVG